MNRAIRKSNLKFSRFKATLSNAKSTDRSNLVEAGIWNRSNVDPISMFNGEGDIQHVNITDDILHVRTGFILDEAPTGPVKVDLKTDFVQIGTSQPVQSESEQIEIPMSDSVKPLFYSYIKNALNRRINLGINDETLKRDTVNLSKTMKVLCEWTSFCGAIRTLKRRDPPPCDEPREPTAQCARC